mmetsp:Transcript_62682/g.149536  ORF Transcript_62682/g.149536 Transcript_62682/m.149536 type:complete len:477 (-) Transcript_62682:71-1501(-)
MGNAPAGARIGAAPASSSTAAAVEAPPEEVDATSSASQDVGPDSLRLKLDNRTGLLFQRTSVEPAELEQVIPEILSSSELIVIPPHIARSGMLAVFTAGVQHATGERSEVEVTRKNRKNKEVKVASGRDCRDVATGQVLSLYAAISVGWISRRRTPVVSAVLRREAEDWGQLRSQAQSESQQGCCNWRALPASSEDAPATIVVCIDKTDRHVLQQRQGLLDALAKKVDSESDVQAPAVTRRKLDETASGGTLEAKPRGASRSTVHTDAARKDERFQDADDDQQGLSCGDSSDATSPAHVTRGRSSGLATEAKTASSQSVDDLPAVKHLPEERRQKTAEVAISAKKAIEERRRREAEEREFRATFGQVVASQDVAFQESLLKDQLKDLAQEQTELQEKLEATTHELEEVTQLHQNAETRLARYGENPKIRAESARHLDRLEELRQEVASFEQRLAEVLAEVVEKQDMLAVATGAEEG